MTMMARSITVERSVPALLGLARVSGLGMGTGFSFIRALRWTSKNFYPCEIKAKLAPSTEGES